MKRILTLLASLALVASGLYVLPASADEEEPTAVPEVVQIEDPLNDANFLNNQDQGPGGPEDNVTPADAGSVSDILKVWFSNTAEEASAHILVERVPPASSTLLYRIYANPGEGPEGSSSRGCLRFLAIIGGRTQGQDTSTYRGADYGAIDDFCNGTDEVVGKLRLEASGDNGIITITGPRSASPLLQDGLSITKPYAVSKVVAGAEGQTYLSSLTSDSTKIGTDYALVSGGTEKPTKPVKPVKPPKPTKPTTPVKKGCDKGKGKKKGCIKTPKPASCAAFTPGEAGKDKPTVTLTDEATEAKPLEQKVTLGQSTADVTPTDASFDSFNVVVDPAAESAGLYATIEFPTRRDYDLDLLHPDGSYAARSRGFNPIAEIYSQPQFNEGHGGQTTANSESLVGIKTNDCGGWTMQVANWLGEGGELSVKLWLGEAKIEPQAEGEEPPH